MLSVRLNSALSPAVDAREAVVVTNCAKATRAEAIASKRSVRMGPGPTELA